MIALQGNTFPHREAIRAAGGKWNPPTKTWSVPDDKHAELQALVGLPPEIDPAEIIGTPEWEQARDKLHAERKAARDADRLARQISWHGEVRDITGAEWEALIEGGTHLRGVRMGRRGREGRYELWELRDGRGVALRDLQSVVRTSASPEHTAEAARLATLAFTGVFNAFSEGVV